MVMLASPEALRGKQVFLLGSTGFLSWASVAMLAATLAVALPLSLRFARALDALVLGRGQRREPGAGPAPRAPAAGGADGAGHRQRRGAGRAGGLCRAWWRRTSCAASWSSRTGRLLALSAIVGRGAAAGGRRGCAQHHGAARVARGRAHRGVRWCLPDAAVAAARAWHEGTPMAGTPMNRTLLQATIACGQPGRAARGGRCVPHAAGWRMGGAGGGPTVPARAPCCNCWPACARPMPGRCNCRAAAWPTGQRGNARSNWRGCRSKARAEGHIAVRDVVRLGRLPHQGLFGAPDAADEAAVDQAMAETECSAFAPSPLERTLRWRAPARVAGPRAWRCRRRCCCSTNPPPTSTRHTSAR